MLIPDSCRPVLLITTLAEYQTAFWLLVGEALTKRGCRVAYLSYDDRSHERLVAAGFVSFNAFELATQAGSKAATGEFDSWVRRLGISTPNIWMSHERIAFGLRDGQELQRKFCAGAAAAEIALCRIRAQYGKPVLVQELGGFLSVVSAFFVARSFGIDNVFVEPSFFKGRLFFSRNTFDAPRIVYRPGMAVGRDVAEYLQATIAAKSIVIPTKDSHQYKSATHKILNLRNAKRLAQKMRDQYLLGKRQEFGYISGYVGTHLRMLMNSIRLRRFYSQLSRVESFVYYPLHVPGDAALTLRAPEYLDQLALVDFLARAVPCRLRVVIKEHPAMIGAVDPARIEQLLSRYDNLVLLDPQTNNFEVLRAATAVVTVNSKSGAEALLLGKPVFGLGDAFYQGAPSITRVENVARLPELLEALSQDSVTVSDPAAVRSFFQCVWDETLPGELYVAKQDAAECFAESLLNVVSTTRPVKARSACSI